MNNINEELTKQQTEGYKVISTKVSELCLMQLQLLAKSRGMSAYEIVQMAIDTLVRYMSEEHNLTSEMERAMAIFEHMVGWANALNLADPTVAKEIDEAIYFLTAKGKEGTRAVYVQRPFMGDWRQNENVQMILEQFLCRLFPERYRRLRLLAIDMECNSVLELVDSLIDTHSKDADLRELRKTFEDANRSESGRPIELGNRPKRKPRRDIEKMTFNFNSDEDID